MEKRGEAIVLIGFMGSGKSSVGRELAARTRLPFYDTDRMVAARVGLTIAEIFTRDREEGFRAYETEALLQVPRRPAIVVTGGGIVLRPENVRTLRELGVVVHLTADDETLFERVSRRSTRPLLQTPDPRARLTELRQLRAPFYRVAADVEVDTSQLSHQEVADAVLQAVENLHVG
ncbi:shikimate kinase [soil metagenome]